MQNIVIIFNAILAICCLWLTWQIWALKNTFKRWAQALALADITAHSLLNNAPDLILQGQMSLQDFNQQLNHLQPQINQAYSLLLTVKQLRWVGKQVHRYRIRQHQPHSKS